MIFKIVRSMRGMGVSDKEGRPELVTPYENWMFETPENGKARYRKFRVQTWREFRYYTEGSDPLTVLGHGPRCGCNFVTEGQGGCIECETPIGYYECPVCGWRFERLHQLDTTIQCPRCNKGESSNKGQVSPKLRQEGVEYVGLLLMNAKGEVVDNIVAMQASLYIMNEQGKTIDSVHCYNG